MEAHTVNDQDGRYLASVFPASPESIISVLELPTTDDDKAIEGRSEYMWIRLANGDLIFGCYPQGAGYEMLEVAVDRDYAKAEGRTV